MKAAKSATKHGIAEADGIHAASYPLWIEPLDDNPGQWRELRLGFDTHARLLETVVVVASDGGRTINPCDESSPALQQAPRIKS